MSNLRFLCDSGSGRELRAARLILCLLCLLSLPLLASACGKRPPPLPPPSPGPTTRGETTTDETTGVDRTVGRPTLDLQVEPPVVRPGESALLIWESQNADRVMIEPAIGTVDPAGRIKLFPDRTTTYSVTAEGPGGSRTEQATVEVDARAAGFSAGDIGEEDVSRLSLEERFELEVKPVFFDFDSAELSEEARLTLDSNARWLSRAENQAVSFVLEGHTDERGTDEYNLALSDKRATAVRDYLIARNIDPSRISVIALGEERPFAKGQTEEDYALNRRVEFVLVRSSP